MLVARLNRDKLRILSDSRLEEARVLLDNKLWTGAYYMSYVEILTEADIGFGARVWHALRESGEFPIEGLFWVLREPRDWHLVIVSPIVDVLGTRDALLKIFELTGNISSRHGAVY